MILRRGRYESWGRYPHAQPARVVPVTWRHDVPTPGDLEPPVLAYGLGRSYGDACLNGGGTLLDTRGLRRFIAFDRETGVLRCEAGVALAEILTLVVPRGWFLPVTPGTKWVTVGGAIANDVHGKNHHRAGTFGRYVRCLELVRSDGRRICCGPDEQAEFFRATIGGLGLTGLILWAEIQLRPVAGPFMQTEVVRFAHLGEFMPLAAASDESHEYTVAWVDCLARGKSLGRGVFIRGNHSDTPAGRAPSRRSLVVPAALPMGVVSRPVVRAFNAAYFHGHRRTPVRALTHFDPFFYPLDAVRHWNRLYGPRGFLQYQCVVPEDDGAAALAELFRCAGASGEASFLAVLKLFGAVASPGILSFPRPGYTLAMDFPVRGPRTFRLLDALDRIVRDARGAVYPAKDAHMSPETFARGFPGVADFLRHRDPGFSSTLWRRVTGEGVP